MTGRCPFSSTVVLVATSMKNSEERSDVESQRNIEILRFVQNGIYQFQVDLVLESGDLPMWLQGQATRPRSLTARVSHVCRTSTGATARRTGDV